MTDLETKPLNAYVINLKNSTDRRRHMENLLAPYNDFLDARFIEAVDCRGLPDWRLNEIWNQEATYKNYGRYMKGGEIGVSLSNRKCYGEMIKNNDEMALFFEDDVAFKDDVDLRKILSLLVNVLRTEKPTVVLLSGSYWFTSSKKISGTDYQLASVFEAMGAMSYMINQVAARKMLSVEKKYLADDWYNWRKNGIKVYALRPHIAGDMDLFGSVIAAGSEGWKRENLSFKNKIRAYYRGIIRRYLGSTGHWEARK